MRSFPGVSPLGSHHEDAGRLVHVRIRLGPPGLSTLGRLLQRRTPGR